MVEPAFSASHHIDLAGRIAIVTGGAQGIGWACAEALAGAGARVAIWDRDGTLAAEAAARLGDGHKAFTVDVADTEGIAAVAAETSAAMGAPYALVHSAGISGPTGPTVAYDPATWRQVVEVNLTGSFNACRAVLPLMVEAGAGRVVLISSIAGKEGNPGAAAYSAAKAGMLALAKSLGKEHADQDIAVNAVTPAAARTRIFDQISQDHIDYMLAKIPRGRFLKVEAAAAMILWLCSPQNGFATGAVFDLSGGRATY